MTSSDLFGILRPIKSAEIAVIRDWRNYPATRANMYTQHEISIAEHEAWWKNISHDPSYLLLVFEREGVPQGVVNFSSIDRSSNKCSWGFYASPTAYIGAGVFMEYVAISYAFEHMKMNRLYCEVLGHNKSVIRLHERFGLTREGCFRQHFKSKEGYVDVYSFAILATEWSLIRPKIEVVLADGIRGIVNLLRIA